MKFDEKPEVDYKYVSTLQTDNIWDMVHILEILEPETPVCYLPSNLSARRGIWTRLGFYTEENGSFIDHMSLELYVDSYYKYHDDSAHGIPGFELNHGEADIPEGAISCQTVDDLLNAIVQFDYVEPEEKLDSAAAAETPKNDEAAEGTLESVEAVEETSGDAAAAEIEEKLPSNLEGKMLFSKDGDPDRNGQLCKKWKLMLYGASDGSRLAVFD